MTTPLFVDELATARRHLEQKEAELDAERQRGARQERRIADLQETIETLERQVRSVVEERDEAKQRVAASRVAVEQHANLQQQANDALERARKAEAKAAKAEAALGAVGEERDRLSQQWSEARAEVTTLRSQIDPTADIVAALALREQAETTIREGLQRLGRIQH